MPTIKSYTDLPQSKKLMEFLPPESADMHYIIMGDDEDPQSIVGLGEYIGILPIIPCWSLAALLDVLPVSCDDGQHCLALINSNPNREIDWLCAYEDSNGNLMMECYANNQIDACVAMIELLHEQKLL